MPRHALARHFDNLQVQDIIEEAMLYMCACPAQVGTEILRLRELYSYQQACISKGETMNEVHQIIAETARLAHDLMEDCLRQVLVSEGWDLEQLKMPEGLREIRQKTLDGE